jgi:hypothetical protein
VYDLQNGEYAWIPASALWNADKYVVKIIGVKYITEKIFFY